MTAAVSRFVVEGAGAVLVQRGDELVQVWQDADGGRFGVRHEFVTFVESVQPVTRWTRGPSGTSPMVAWDGDALVALVMPYRLG